MKIEVGQYYKDSLMLGVLQVTKVYKTVPKVKIRFVKPINQDYRIVYSGLEEMAKEAGLWRNGVVGKQAQLYSVNKAYIEYLEKYCSLIPRLKAELIYET